MADWHSDRASSGGAGGALEWIPQRRTQPTVCVVSVMTDELLADWGGAVVESNANWAVAHGYRYTVFTRLLTPPTLHPVWSNPRALELTLLRGEAECARAFYLDGDALVVGVERSLLALLARFLPPPVHVAFSCHSPFADARGGCRGPLDGAPVGMPGQSTCVCARAEMATRCSSRQRERMLKRPVPGKEAVPWCHINSGAALVRNSASSRALLADWAAMRGCSPGAPGRGAPEQACAQRLQARRRAQTDVVSAAHFNTPAWYHARLAAAADPIVAYAAARAAAWAPLGPDGTRRPGANMQCFNDSSAFVCHMWNAMRYDRATVREVRRVSFRRAAAALRPRLRVLLAARGEAYTSLDEVRPLGG